MKVHTARKSYRCRRCRNRIEPGDRYARTAYNSYHYPACYYIKSHKKKKREVRKTDRRGKRDSAWARRSAKKILGVSSARQIASQDFGRGFRKFRR